MFQLLLAAGALAVSAYSTQQQIKAAKDAQRFREMQAEEEKKRANVQAVRTMREQIRAQRAEAARVMNTAAMSGTGSSSGTAGAVGGSMSDMASNANYAQVMSGFDQRVGQLGMGAARASTQGQVWGSYGSLAGTIFSGAGGFTNFRSEK